MLLKELATFLIDVATPLFREVMTSRQAISAKDLEKRRITEDLVAEKRINKRYKEQLDSNQRLLGEAQYAATTAIKEKKVLEQLVQALEKDASTHGDMKSRLAEVTEEVKKLKRYNLSRKQKVSGQSRFE